MEKCGRLRLVAILILLMGVSSCAVSETAQPDLDVISFSCSTGYFRIRDGVPLELDEASFHEMMSAPQEISCQDRCLVQGMSVINLYSFSSVTQVLQPASFCAIYDKSLYQVYGDTIGIKHRPASTTLTLRPGVESEPALPPINITFYSSAWENSSANYVCLLAIPEQRIQFGTLYTIYSSPVSVSVTTQKEAVLPQASQPLDGLYCLMLLDDRDDTPIPRPK